MTHIHINCLVQTSSNRGDIYPRSNQGCTCRKLIVAQFEFISCFFPLDTITYSKSCQPFLVILDQIALLVDDQMAFSLISKETFGPILSIFRVKGTGEEADREALVGGRWFWLRE